MLRYIKSSLLLLAVLLGSQVYGSATDDLREEGDSQAAIPPAPQPPIKFTHFEYHPNTQEFKGRFFDETAYILQQIVGFYLEKTYNTSEHLNKSQKKLESLRKGFNEEQYKNLAVAKAVLKEEGKNLGQDENNS